MTTEPRRPGYHLTAPVGWINDPLGVTWHEESGVGRYELFYQLNPDAPVWAPACRWGQATSGDLVRWRDLRIALEPAPSETGCWSGSVVVDGGAPVIVYTSVLGGSTDLGRISLAHGDASWRRWSADPAGPVIPAPAPGQGYAHVRDPFVWRSGDRWRMALGAGRTDGRPAVLQYSSADLRRWDADGVLAEPEPGRDGPGGTVWECPQLFRLGGAWVMVVSVWDDGPADVACAVGEYDGRRFTARAWHRLAAAPYYATTAFADSRGRRCVMSWVRGVEGSGSQWAGALSVPWLLERDGDRVTVVPHPDVDTLRAGLRAERASVPLSAVVSAPVGRHADVVVRATPAGRPIELALAVPGGRLLGVRADPVAGEVRLSVPGQPDASVPLRPGAGGEVDVRLLVDAGMVEVFSGGHAAAARLPHPVGEPQLRIAGGAGARLERLSVHEMERPTG